MAKRRAPISNDLRRGLISAYDRKVGSTRELAAIFSVSETFAKNIIRQRAKNGHPDRVEQRRGTPRRLLLPHRTLLEQWITDEPRLTLAQLKDRLEKECGVQIGTTQIWRVTKELRTRSVKSRVGASDSTIRNGSAPGKQTSGTPEPSQGPSCLDAPACQDGPARPVLRVPAEQTSPVSSGAAPPAQASFLWDIDQSAGT